ncbi:MAG: NCS2 family permease [Actinomycetaceae bacterium]|nr:NCS2 family permease [Actinomycetaceae bacterium]MDU0969626.1 NCS2 family permease [Actinomycetaceae bacterium]
MSVEKTENPTRKASGLDAFFHITERGSSIGQEIRGGLVTFFAMAYILVVNASILSAAAPKGIDPASIAAGTALVAGVMTILMGVVANFPMGLAAGMGLNAIVAFTLANPHALGLTYAEAMGLIFWEGVAITILVLTGFREAVFKAVPAHLKTAISVGIGLFICFVGLINAGIIRPGGTYVQLGVNGSLIGWPALVFVFGLVVIIVLYLRNVQGAILIGIAVSTVLAVIVQAVSHLGIRGTDAAGNTVHVNGWATNIPALEGSPIQLPHFATLGTIDFFGAFHKLGAVAVILIVFSLMLADFFDTMGTMVAVGQGANLLDENGNPPRTREVLLIDSLAAVVGGLGGVSSNTSYVESTSGVAEGARTGLASVVTGVLFLLSMFIAPLVELVPAEAASISLVFVGFLMMMNVADIDWRNPMQAVPCFLTIAMMPFAYSITAGIGFGFIAFVVCEIAMGKAKKIQPLMWVVSILFVIYFCLEPIQNLLH